MVITSILLALFVGGFGLALIVGAIFLQIYLSKKENKWLGLILPVICFSFALVTSLCSIPAYDVGTLTVEKISPDGAVAETVVDHDSANITNKVSNNLGTFSILLVLNIPTLILLLIYVCCRQGLHKKSEIDKMNIQDLE